MKHNNDCDENSNKGIKNVCINIAIVTGLITHIIMAAQIFHN